MARALSRRQGKGRGTLTAGMLNTLALFQSPAPRAGGTIMLIYLVAFGLIMWLLIIRPQRKMQEKHKAMVDAVKKGDEVMTEGGIIGHVVHIADDRLTIKSGDNTRVVVARVKIARVFAGTETE